MLKSITMPYYLIKFVSSPMRVLVTNFTYLWGYRFYGCGCLLGMSRMLCRLRLILSMFGRLSLWLLLLIRWSNRIGISLDGDSVGNVGKFDGLALCLLVILLCGRYFSCFVCPKYRRLYQNFIPTSILCIQLNLW